MNALAVFLPGDMMCDRPAHPDPAAAGKGLDVYSAAAHRKGAARVLNASINHGMAWRRVAALCPFLCFFNSKSRCVICH